MDGFIKFDDLDFENYTYNLQKTEGKPYKVKGCKYKNNIIDVYGQTLIIFCNCIKNYCFLFKYKNRWVGFNDSNPS